MRVSERQGAPGRPGHLGQWDASEREGPGLPYKGVPLLLTTWTVCTVCWVPVAHLDQRRHDEWHARQGEALADDEPPVLERAS
jgi:hypothetical protein